MVTAPANEEIWNREYQETRSIPSSTRRLPSKALVLFDKLAPLDAAHSVLDAGCGNGRNALYLALKGCDVVALDFSSAALECVKAAADSVEVAGRLSLKKTNLLDTLPFTSGRFDLCLDSYVSCHFTEPADYQHYWSELTRVTRSGGWVFSSVFAIDDEYYKSILDRQGPETRVVTDPKNGIAKKLYTEDEFKASLPPSLYIEFFLKFQFIDRVFANDYVRSLFVTVLKKPQQSILNCE